MTGRALPKQFTAPTDMREVGTMTNPNPSGSGMPQPTPDNPFPNPNPNPTLPTYSALDLMGEVYLGLWGVGKIPAGPMRDPAAAQRACAELLAAFGINAVDRAATPVDTYRAAGAVAVVCGVAA